MRKIQVLDCTLRDGGYCNDCHFGFENEKKILNGLIEANIDIIECGFLINTLIYDKNYSRFSSLDQVARLIPQNRDGKLFVLLADHGKFVPEELPKYDGNSIDGLRIAFHKKDCIEGLKDCQKVKDKGYKVFVQAMVSISYTDKEFLDLINRVNEIEPYAFYIVDSFGMMKNKDLTRLFYMVEHNLKDTIIIGFHSHNNMQLAYSNAQNLVNIQTNRDLIIDSSVYGMGRGAGNLNTELFVEYLNNVADGEYKLKPLLNIIDEILNDFYLKDPWGYSLPNYLSASHNAHPNYAAYFADKNTLTVDAMDDIFNMMDDEKKISYDKKYAEEIYLKYMANGETQEAHKSELKKNLSNKYILLIAPGISSETEKNKIMAFSKNKEVISISINYDYQYINTDYIFLSNLRRFRELEDDQKEKCIVTSNIPADKVYLQTGYQELLSDMDSVRDNAGLMAIKFFIKYGVRDFYLAGFDGYDHDQEKNYANDQLAFVSHNAILDAMNKGMEMVLNQLSDIINITFVTTPRNVILKKSKTLGEFTKP